MNNVLKFINLAKEISDSYSKRCLENNTVLFGKSKPFGSASYDAILFIPNNLFEIVMRSRHFDDKVLFRMNNEYFGFNCSIPNISFDELELISTLDEMQLVLSYGRDLIIDDDFLDFLKEFND